MVVRDSGDGEQIIGAVRLMTTSERARPHEMARDMAMGRVPEPVRKVRRWEAGSWSGGRYGPLVTRDAHTRDEAVDRLLRYLRLGR